MIVLDASVTLTFFLPDEHDPLAVRVFQRASAEGAVVPPHWLTEVMNGTRMAGRRGRLSQSQLEDLVDAVMTIEIETASRPDLGIVKTVLDLSRRHGLTVYGATYLELAQRRNCPLATRDAKLADAAKAVGVPLAG